MYSNTTRWPLANDGNITLSRRYSSTVLARGPLGSATGDNETAASKASRANNTNHDNVYAGSPNKGFDMFDMVGSLVPRRVAEGNHNGWPDLEARNVAASTGRHPSNDSRTGTANAGTDSAACVCTDSAATLRGCWCCQVPYFGTSATQPCPHCPSSVPPCTASRRHPTLNTLVS